MTHPDWCTKEVWEKAQPTDATINGMCMTWRHDFGITAPEPDADGRRAWTDGAPMGMTQAERNGLRLQMRQIWNHDIAPVIARAILSAQEEQTERIAELEADIAQRDDLLVKAEKFRFGPSITVESRALNRWAVCQTGEVMNAFDEWEYEPTPGSRTDEFLARTRFSFADAVMKARAAIRRGEP